MAAYGEFLGGNGKNCYIVFSFKARSVEASRDGLVGYDAALTQLRSGVRFPLFVACSFLSFSPQRCSSFASFGSGEGSVWLCGPCEGLPWSN